jgi:hypothetical protein
MAGSDFKVPGLFYALQCCNLRTRLNLQLPLVDAFLIFLVLRQTISMVIDSKELNKVALSDHYAETLLLKNISPLKAFLTMQKTLPRMFSGSDYLCSVRIAYCIKPDISILFPENTKSFKTQRRSLNRPRGTSDVLNIKLGQIVLNLQTHLGFGFDATCNSGLDQAPIPQAN